MEFYVPAGSLRFPKDGARCFPRSVVLDVQRDLSRIQATIDSRPLILGLGVSAHRRRSRRVLKRVGSETEVLAQFLFKKRIRPAKRFFRAHRTTRCKRRRPVKSQIIHQKRIENSRICGEPFLEFLRSGLSKKFRFKSQSPLSPLKLELSKIIVEPIDPKERLQSGHRSRGLSRRLRRRSLCCPGTRNREARKACQPQ